MRQGLLLLCCLLVVAPAWARNDELNYLTSQALRVVGTPFRYGGQSPETGFDCSGLVVYAFERAWGMVLPRVTDEQRKIGRAVSRAELKPGDLLFHNTRNRPYSHVGIYLGDGRFVHAPRSGATVRVESAETPYWRARFNGARRLDPPTF